MTSSLLGLGTAVPPGLLTQTDAAELAVSCCCSDARQADVLRTIFRRTRVSCRRVALLADADTESLRRFYPPAKDCVETRGGRGPTTGERMIRFERHAPPLALAACGHALHDASVAPGEITHLITVSCTGFVTPGVERHIIESLEIEREVRRASIGFMGCHGALNGLQTAAAIIGADPSARVLLCAVELCSLHFQYGWSPDSLVANALFADGAASVVLGAGRGTWKLVDTASRLIADTDEDMTWKIGDHGFFMTLSPRVPQTLATNLRPWIDDWLAGHDLTVDTIGSWAIHAGGPRIVRTVTDRLGLDTAASRTAHEVLATCGNMSSATVLFIIDRLRRERAPLPCVALAFGPGLVAEAALFA